MPASERTLRTIRKALALLANALCVGAYWQLASLIWLDGGVANWLALLVMMSGAAGAGRWSEYIFYLEVEAEDASK